MKNEVYDLVLNGELVEGFEKRTIVPKIAKLFKLDENVANKILNNTPQKIINNVTWQKAVKYRDHLKAIGLIVDINVVLNPQLFRASVVPTSKNTTIENMNIEVDKTSAQSFQLLRIKLTKLVPAIFYPPHSEPVLDQHEEPIFELKSYNYTINPIFVLLISFVVALVVQKYFTLLVVQLGTGIIVTMASMTLFFVMLLFLPKMLSPNRVFTLRHGQEGKAQCGEAYLLCAQIPNMNPFKNSYRVYSSDDAIIAMIQHYKIKNMYECQDVKGLTLFSSSDEYDVDDITIDVAREFRDEILDFSILGYIKTIFKFLKRLGFWMRKETYSPNRSEVKIVRDSRMKKSACFYPAKDGFIELPTGFSDEKTAKQMTAFLLVCTGVG